MIFNSIILINVYLLVWELDTFESKL